MKRTFSLILAGLMLLTLVAGCGSSEESQAPSSEAAQSGEAAAQGTPKDTIIWAQSGDINSFDFHVGKQPLTFDVTCNMFDCLVKWDADGKVVPALAESWEFLDEDTIQFKLRQDVTFHDGTPMTAADVKYTYDRARDHTIVKNNFSWLESTDIVDDYTVNINTIGAFAPVLNALTSPLAGIMPKHIMEENENAMAEHPIGTGPYKFVEWKQGEYVKMEAYEDYWGGVPKTKNLIMQVIPEASQRTILLETGAIDVAYDVLPVDASKLEENPNTKIMHAPSYKTLYFSINSNSSNPALANPKVRQALEMAIDKTGIADAILYGYAIPTGSNIAPGVFGFDPDLPADRYDVEGAKKLLAEAGYADGFDLKIWTATNQDYQETCVAIQEMFRQIGVNATIDVMDNQVMIDRMVGGEDYDLSCSMWYNLQGDADYVLYSNNAPDSTSNFANYNNPEVMDLIMEARKQTNEADRAATYHKVVEILEEDRPQIPLFAYENVVGLGAGVEGFELSPITAYRYENVVVYE